jgi:hypothetical protein
MTPICVVKLVMALPDDIQDKLAKRVDDCYCRRKLQERLGRRTTTSPRGEYDFRNLMSASPTDMTTTFSDFDGNALPTGVFRQESLESTMSTLSAPSNLLNSGVSASGDPNDRAVMALTKLDSLSDGSMDNVNSTHLTVVNPIDFAVSQAVDAFMAMPMDDMDEFGNTIHKERDLNDNGMPKPSATEMKASAATAIQRLARGADARSIADKRYQSVSSYMLRAKSMCAYSD